MCWVGMVWRGARLEFEALEIVRVRAFYAAMRTIWPNFKLNKNN